jgi:hypothetical protein
MNATTRTERRTATRTARNGIRNTRRTTRAARRINHDGHGTLAQYGMAHGLTRRDAASMAGTMRKTAHKIGMNPVATIRVHTGRRMRDAAVYTPRQIGMIALAYRPRKAEYKAIAATLRLAA